MRNRNASVSRQLAERWVHRQGLASFERFRHGLLSQEAGEEACAWLGDVMQTTSAGVPAGRPAAAPETPEASEPLGDRVSAEVDAAIEAMLASFSLAPRQAPSADGSPDPQSLSSGGKTPSSVAAAAAPPSQDPFAELPFPWPESFAVPALQAVSDEPGPAGVAAGDAEPAANEPEPVRPAEPDGGGLRQRLWRRLPKAARLMREALGGANATSWWSREPQRQDPVTGSEELQTADGAEGAAQDEAPAHASSGMAPESPEAWAFGLPGSATAESEPAPHIAPTLAWLDWPTRGTTGLPSAPAPLAATEPPAALALELPGRSGGSEPVPPASSADRLMRRLQSPGASLREQPPAPRPSGLAELSAWLPAQDLPRAS